MNEKEIEKLVRQVVMEALSKGKAAETAKAAGPEEAAGLPLKSPTFASRG